MTDYSILDDVRLVQLIAQQRDQTAFAELHSRYRRAAFTYVLGITRNRELAEDAVQECFAILWKQMGQLDINTSVKAYVFTVVRREALRAMRKNGRLDELAAEVAALTEHSADTLDRQLDFNELFSLLEQGIDSLPPRMRDVYRKHKEEGLSHRDIAAQLGITENSSKTILNRAVALLRAKLSAYLTLVLYFIRM